MNDVYEEDKLRASIKTLAGKFSEIERNKRRIQVIDLPPSRRTVVKAASKKRGKIVLAAVEIDGIEVRRTRFVATSKTSKLKQLIKKATECRDIFKM